MNHPILEGEELQRVILLLAGRISLDVGMAAAIEAARGFMQVQVSTVGNGDAFDAVAVARNTIATRVEHCDVYGESWRSADVAELAPILAYAYVELCIKDREEVPTTDPDAPAAPSEGKAPDVDF
jgi:hypothetical protein